MSDHFADKIEQLIQNIETEAKGYWRDLQQASEAKIREQAAEIEEFRRIRDLLVAALVTATGATDAAVRVCPMTVAVAHRAEIEQLQDRVSARDKDTAE